MSDTPEEITMVGPPYGAAVIDPTTMRVVNVIAIGQPQDLITLAPYFTPLFLEDCRNECGIGDRWDPETRQYIAPQLEPGYEPPPSDPPSEGE